MNNPTDIHQPIRKQKLLYLVSVDNYFYSHRLNLALAAKKAGYEVLVACKIDKYQDLIEKTGITVYPLHYLSRSSLNPFRQLLSLKELWTLYNDYKPDIAHHVAMKPVVLGSLIARLCRVQKVINAFGGLGYLFTETQKKSIKKNIISFLVVKLLNLLLKHPNVSLILQNEDDHNFLMAKKSIRPDWMASKKVSIIRGAGIDIHAFPQWAFPSLNPKQPKIIITCVARMLRDKGIIELIKAAEILLSRNINAKILLYGDIDPENPASLKQLELQTWHEKNIIEWHGHCDNIAHIYQNCHIAVLPSYREGLPKSLLEAASTGRPIVTTDVPGCREVVKHNLNGLLVQPRDPFALANALEKLCQDEGLRIRMGNAGRRLVEEHFLDTLIHEQTLALYQKHSDSTKKMELSCKL